MILLRFRSCLFGLFFIPLLSITAQSDPYKGYEASFLYATQCETNAFFDITSLKCESCPENAQPKRDGNL